MEGARVIELFFREKPVKYILAVKSAGKCYVSEIAKKIDCTFAHALKLTEEFEKLKIVETEKEGKKRVVRLTEEGEELASAFEIAVKKLKRLSSGDEK
jgi:predicted transcriptional regulator